MPDSKDKWYLNAEITEAMAGELPDKKSLQKILDRIALENSKARNKKKKRKGK